MNKVILKSLDQNGKVPAFVDQAKTNLKRAGRKNRRALLSSKPYDILVFIGRFQPLHKGHQAVIDRALEMAERVLVLIGSAGKARSVRNPFTFEERYNMIRAVYTNRVVCLSVEDAAYNDTDWVMSVQKKVNDFARYYANKGGFENYGHADVKIGLVGWEKDHTSYYLKLFPQWDNEGVPPTHGMCATNIRNLYFDDALKGRWEWDVIVDDKVWQFLESFKVTAEYTKLAYEHKYIVDYKKQWGEGPHLTGDSLVQVGGNVLLIKRGKEYGHGLYALPGGFLKPYETFYEGALRELKEETRLKVPVPVLKGSLHARDTFDDPHRSERGRIVTQCFHFKLENETELPEVRGSDDAEWAGFVDFTTLKEADFFEDHYHIIRKMLAI